MPRHEKGEQKVHSSEVTELLSYGDVVNVVLVEAAYPFVRSPEDEYNNRPRNGLQGRVIFADAVGLHINSHGGRCMPLFEEDSAKIDDSDLTDTAGKFFPWQSVLSVVKVTGSAEYETAWEKHERDEEAFHNGHGSFPASSC